MRTRSAAGLICLVLSACLPGVGGSDVRPGVEVLVAEHAEDLRGKRVAILTNPTGVDRKLNSTIDLVRELEGVNVVRLFAPEHGIRGGYLAGARVRDAIDVVSGLPVVSLYGRTRRPTPEMLAGLDVVLYDIQDVGARYYTFISTLTYMMEECEKAGVEVWVLDRPEPMGGTIVGGPMIDEDLISFIGVHNVPQVYGMTPGEWAKMIQAERTPDLMLRVIEMEGWKRGMNYGELGWPWVPPSQHIPRWESCFFYAMTGTIGERGTLSEGVGYTLPFEVVGGPKLNGMKLKAELDWLRLEGVRFRPITFTPRYGNFANRACHGVQIHITDYDSIDPTEVSLELMAALLRAAPEENAFRKERGARYDMFLKSLGDRELAEAMAEGEDPRRHRKRLESEIEAFRKRRAPYLIYD